MSYARTDRDFVVRLCASLAERGKELWVDLESIPPAADWRDRVGAGIRSSKALLFILSPQSVASRTCGEELEQAAALHKLIVPVVWRDVGGGTVPAALERRNWIRLRDDDDFQAGVEAVLTALEDDLEWRDRHARLAIRAEEWVEAGLDRSLLLRGKELEDAERWLAEEAEHRERATREQARYVTAGRAAAVRRRRQAATGAFAGIAVLAAVGVFGIVQLLRSESSERLALARQLRTEVSSIAQRQPDVALLVGLQSLRFAPDRSRLEARAALVPGFARARHPAVAAAAHIRGAETVAFGGDGATVFSSGEDGIVRAWRVGAAEQSRHWRAGQSEVVALAVTRDGRRLATVGAGTEVRLWDAATGRLLHRLTGHAGFAVIDVAFSPDGRVLASVGDEDETVRLWATASGRPLGAISPASSVAFSPDGETFATGGRDGRIRLWRIDGTKPLGSPFGPGGNAVTDLAYSPDGAFVASASGAPRVGLWDVEARRRVASLGSGRTALWSVAFEPDGTRLATGSDAGTLQRWDYASGARVGEPLRGHAGPVLAAAFSPDGRRLASASSDGTVRLWTLRTTVELGTTLGHHGEVGRALAFSADGRTLASGGADGWMALWDPAGRRRPLPLGPFTADGRTVSVVGVAFRRGGVVSVDDDGALRSLDRTIARFGPAWTAAFSADGRRVALSGWPSGVAHGPGADRPDASWLVHVYDSETGRRLAGPVRQERGMRAIALSPDGGRLATAGNTPGMTLWDLQPGAPSRTDLQVSATVDALAFGAGGDALAAGGSDGAITVWDVGAARRSRTPLRGQDGSVTGLALSDDGRLLVAGGDDGTVRIWDLANGFSISLPGGRAPIHAVALAPDAERVAAVDRDGVVRAWDMRLRTWVSRACELAGRNLTLQEWERWIGPEVAYERTCRRFPAGRGAPSSAPAAPLP